MPFINISFIIPSDQQDDELGPERLSDGVCRQKIQQKKYKLLT